MTEKTKTHIPPYLSWKTFGTYIQSLQQALPSRIDTSGMIRLSGGLRAPMLSALKFLKLIKDDGTPEPELRELVNSSYPDKKDTYTQTLRKVIENAYPSLLDPKFDLANTTPKQFTDGFEKLGVSGETTRKSIRFFLDAAKDAGIKVSPIVLDARKKGPKLNGSPKPKVRKDGGESKGSGSPSYEIPPIRTSMLDRLIEKFPEFNPEWDLEAQKAWFEAYSRLLKRAEDEEE
jgi:hypothetical protein